MRFFALIATIIAILLASSVIFVPTITAQDTPSANVDGKFSTSNQEACVFIVTVDVAGGFSQPVTDPAFQVASVQGGLSYQVLRSAQQHFLVKYTIGGEGVWLDRRSGYIEGNCLNIPVDETPLTDYDSLCFFSSANEVTIYTDATLEAIKTPIGNLPPNREVLVTAQQGDAYFLHFDHAMGGWVAKNSGTVRGNCENLSIPDNHSSVLRGTTLDNTRLWSEPNVQTGVVVADVAAGTTLIIEDGPRLGSIRTDTQDQGHFYFVRIDSDTTSGWIWSARLLTGYVDPTQNVRAVALDNARLWSLPDVTTGEITQDIPVGTVVTIEDGPQLGRIRVDTYDLGHWYLVSLNSGSSGWVWSERLSAGYTSVSGIRATALENARLWSQPDVSVGTVVTDLDVGTRVIVEQSPQLGRIRVDTNDLGHWYFVQVEGTSTSGWIWSPRLSFQ